HLTEVDAVAVYETLANLVKITTGKRYTMDRFGDLYRPPDRARYEQHPPSARRRRISSSSATRPDDLGDAPPQKSGGPARRGEQDNRSAETQMDRLQRTHGRGRGSH